MVAEPSTVHRLKVTLKGIRPPIWRRIEVASNTGLHELSAILEAAMGWGGDHLHAFVTGGVTYQIPSEFDDFDRYRTFDERKSKLAKVLPAVGSRMVFEYDFGDSWAHDVVVEAITPAGVDTAYPVCVGGKRACPPDDCGGPWGYGELLQTLADPGHEDHLSMLEWCGGSIDPDAFNAADITHAMRYAEPWDD